MNHHSSMKVNNNTIAAERSGKKGLNFGWSPVAMNMHWVLGTVLLIIAVIHAHILPAVPLATALPAIISMMLFLGGYFIRSSRKQESMTLPYVDLFGAYKDGPILDVGCGAGRTTIAISKVSGDRMIVALDRFDAQYIQGGGNTLIERNASFAGISERVHIVKGDAEKIECEDGIFDAVVSTNALDHSNQKLKILKEINRVLKPKGRFLLVVMVPNLFTFSVAGPLCHFFSAKSKWNEFFGQSGFKKLDEGVINNCAYFLVEKE